MSTAIEGATTDLAAAGTADANSYSARPQDELLPFLSNFHDIFTTIGVVILAAGLGLGVGQVMDGLSMEAGSVAWQLSLIGLIGGVGVVFWLISALLVGSQRRILPGIVLSVAFSVSAATVIGWLYFLFATEVAGIEEQMMQISGADVDVDGVPTRADVMAMVNQLPLVARAFPIVIGLAALVPTYLYYRAFRLPFAGGLVGVSLVLLAVLTLTVIDPYTLVVYNPTVSLAAGLALFLAGMWFDARDPERTTRLSGTGFWLHFFAAPVLLGAVLTITRIGWSLDFTDIEAEMTAFFAAIDSAEAVSIATTTLIVMGVFALVSLLINRRALIVAGLVTTGISIGVLVNQLGMGVGAGVAVTLLALGGLVVVLGAAWNPLRAVLLAPFPRSGPIAAIFPPATNNE